MRTPAGFECRFFYGNYYRGRKQEECRLIGFAPRPHHWTPSLCNTCPVPKILMANSCPNMTIKGKVQRSLLGLKREVKVEAYCTKSQQAVSEPEVGCGQCHPLPYSFLDENE